MGNCTQCTNIAPPHTAHTVAQRLGAAAAAARRRRTNSFLKDPTARMRALPQHYEPKLDTENIYEAKDTMDRWWPVTLLARNADGTFAAHVHDGIASALSGKPGKRWPVVKRYYIRYTADYFAQYVQPYCASVQHTMYDAEMCSQRCAPISTDDSSVTVSQQVSALSCTVKDATCTSTTSIERATISPSVARSHETIVDANGRAQSSDPFSLEPARHNTGFAAPPTTPIKASVSPSPPHPTPADTPNGSTDNLRSPSTPKLSSVDFVQQANPIMQALQFGYDGVLNSRFHRKLSHERGSAIHSPSFVESTDAGVSISPPLPRVSAGYSQSPPPDILLVMEG